MLFIIRPMRGHVQNGCIIAKYWISIKLNYCETEFGPRAQERSAGHLFTLCLLLSLDSWKQVCNGTPSARLEDQAAVPQCLLSLLKTWQPSFSWGTEAFCWWECSHRWQALHILPLNQEKSSGRLGSPLSSIHFASQSSELAQWCLTENSFF